jgi:dTDP-4-amino-4,6-dideoxygalactose transaminase
MIPFFAPDLFAGDRPAFDALLHEVATDPEQRFILGPRVERLEAALAEAIGAADVVACGSGTMALTMILRALGAGPGTEVIVPAFGCAPLASSVLSVGAAPVFADVDPVSLVMDPVAAEKLISARTRVLVPAHQFSVMADMPRFRDLARRHSLRLVEDSAVAQGARLAGIPAGLWGDAGLYSFVQVKTFGMPGEGGVVVTGDPELGRCVRQLRNHGQDGRRRFLHHTIGYNSRFDEVQAAFQLHRLPTFPARLARRAEIGRYYSERFAALADRGVQTPPAGTDGRCFYVYNLLADDRAALAAHLTAAGVASHVYYPAPLPRQPAFAAYAPPGAAWPAAESASRRCLALPIYPHLTDAQMTHIADAVCAFVPSTRALR